MEFNGFTRISIEFIYFIQKSSYITMANCTDEIIL